MHSHNLSKEDIERRLQGKELQMQSIQYIARVLSSELNLDRLLPLIMDEVTRLMQAERSTFYIVDHEVGQLWSKVAQKAEIKEIRLPIGKGIAGHVANTGEIINIEDAYQDDRFDPATDKKTGFRTRSILCMPVYELVKETNREARIVGVLQILNKKNGVFNHDDEELLKSLSSQIAVAYSNSSLYMALERRMQELNLLYEVEKELNQADELEKLLQLLMDMLQKTLNVEAVLLSLKESSGVHFNQRAAKNIDLSDLSEDGLKHFEDIRTQVLKSGETYVNNDVHGDESVPKALSSELGLEIRQIVTAPLIIENQVIGLLEIFNKAETNEIFRSEDIRLVTSLASQIARTIETLRLREEKMKAERLAAIGNMMSAIVHDLRTPMNNIYGFVDLIKEEEDGETRREFADVVIDQIKLINNMAQDVLHFSKGETNVLPVKYPVNKLLDEFSRRFAKDIEKQGFQFQSACHVASNVYIDPEKATRIFMNIMKNSLEAMKKGGRFSIEAHDHNGEIEFRLSDTGKGIPPAIKDRLFESFVTSGKKEGTGLGLAIVKELMDQHNGRIEVDSKEGEGTTFKLYFKRI